MKLNVKKASSKRLVLFYQKGFNTALVSSIVSFFVASLVYWFAFVPANKNTWIHQGPLLKREGDNKTMEVLFRMPNHEAQQNFYVPLDEPFIRTNEDRNRYELILFGRTSEKRKIFQNYERRIGTYPTKNEAQRHYKEILDFLMSDRKEFIDLSDHLKPEETILNQIIPYSPFILALLISSYFLFFPIVRAQLIMDRNSQSITLKRSSLLIPRSKVFKLANFSKAELKKIPKGNLQVYQIILEMNSGEKALLCQYSPPYRDDKYIASLSQHTRLINWWSDDELIEKYGDSILNTEE